MFTGLIEATGSIVSFTPTPGAARLVVAAPALAGLWRAGDSIAVNGVCLTALPVANPAHFAADLANETLDRTTLASLPTGAVVNLELPTPAGSPLGGHVVQGHVDSSATVLSLLPLRPDIDSTDWRLTLELPSPIATQIAPQIVPQGSITVDGISLTVAHVNFATPDLPRIEIAIIPHTYRSTNLHTLQPGSLVNIETDVLAKCAAAQRTRSLTDWLTPAYLLANGY